MPSLRGRRAHARRSLLVSPRTAFAWEPTVIGSIDASILNFVQHIYNVIGWPGVVGLMALESAAIPIPSEVIMPLAGWFLVKNRGLGWEWLFVAALLGALGNTFGAWVTYWIGAAGGRRLLNRYGHYILISRNDLDQADRWFACRGGIAVFIGRLLPVVRTFISIPAGVGRMDFRLFSLLTFSGSFLWSLLLVWIGYLLGSNYDRVHKTLAPFDYPIIAFFVLLVLWWIYHRIRQARREQYDLSPDDRKGSAP